MSSEDEDENKKDWDKEKDPPDKKKKQQQSNNEQNECDDGFSKERRSQQLLDGLSRLSQDVTPICDILQDDQTPAQDGIINRHELRNIRQRLEQCERRNRIITLELDKANLETRRTRLQLENLKATSQLKLERAELETDKVRFQGQKEKAETLIEMLRMKQELQQVKRENQVKSVEISKLKTEIHRLKTQVETTSSSQQLPGGNNMASYNMASGLQFLAMQQNTQLVQGRMLHSHTRNNTAAMNRSSSHSGEGYYVCAQCMAAEFPNSLEGQRMLEVHLETEHPLRNGALTDEYDAGRGTAGTDTNKDNT